MRGASNAHEWKQKCTQSSIRKPEGKRPLGRPRSRWEHDIKTDLKEI